MLDLKNFPEIDDSIKNEDIRVVGDWEDYSGSGEKPSQEVMMQGISENEPGTPKAQIEDSEVEFTDRGNKATTTRTRSRLIHMEFNKDGIGC